MNEEQKPDNLEPGEINVPTIPSSWELVDFELAFELVSTNDRKVPSGDYLSEGPLPVVDQGRQFIGGFTDKVDFAIEPGDGLLVFGDHTRAFKAVDFSFAAGADGIKILRPRMTSMKYAFYACSSLRFPNKGYARHFSHLRKCKFPVAPSEEQKRIVSKLDELFSQIENGERTLEQVRKLVERYRQSVLKAAVTGELTREWREQHAGELESGEALLTRILEARRQAWESAELAKMTAKNQRPNNDAWKKKYKEPPVPDSSLLAELPFGWMWASVEQLSSAVVDGVHKKPNYVSSGIPFVTVRNLTAGPGISLEKLNYITAEDHEEFTKRTKPERGDVLVSKDGTLGTIRLVDTDVNFSIFVSVALVKPVERKMGRFMEVALSSPSVQAQMVPKGTGLQHIHLEDLRQDCLPLCSVAEQSVIVDLVALRLSQIDQIDSYLQGQVRQATSLRQAVLKAAFSGCLVPQNPSDEPASILLECIAAQRAAAASDATAAKERKSQSRFPSGMTMKRATPKASAGKTTPRKPKASKGKAKA